MIKNEPIKSDQEITWNGETLYVRQRVLHTEFSNACNENHAYVNCSVFSLFSPAITVNHKTINSSHVADEVENQTNNMLSSIVWFERLSDMLQTNNTRFCLPDHIKLSLSLEMEAIYLTDCVDEKTYRYLRVCLLIAFKACVKRAENLCMMHMVVNNKIALNDEDVLLVMKLFNFRDITNHVVKNGSFPPTKFDVL